MAGGVGVRIILESSSLSVNIWFCLKAWQRFSQVPLCWYSVYKELMVSLLHSDILLWRCHTIIFTFLAVGKTFNTACFMSSFSCLFIVGTGHGQYIHACDRDLSI